MRESEAGGPARYDPSSESASTLPRGLREALDATYEMEREVGRGGMAVVWSARRLSNGQSVAVKFLRPEIAETLGAHRFLREIGIASHVTSPSLVPLEKSGEANGVPYYVMPLAAGGSLRQRLLAERQLPIGAAVDIARCVAQALVELHRNGFIHRDIKPENILLADGDAVWLADYGIARAVTAAATDAFTSTG